MPKVKTVEKRIWDVEEFAVRILSTDGRDLRGDRGGMPQYDYERAAKNSMTVAAWVQTRFAPQFPGYTVEVLNAANEAVPGNTQLGSVRDTYLDD